MVQKLELRWIKPSINDSSLVASVCWRLLRNVKKHEGSVLGAGGAHIGEKVALTHIGTPESVGPLCRAGPPFSRRQGGVTAGSTKNIVDIRVDNYVPLLDGAGRGVERFTPDSGCPHGPPLCAEHLAFSITAPQREAKVQEKDRKRSRRELTGFHVNTLALGSLMNAGWMMGSTNVMDEVYTILSIILVQWKKIRVPSRELTFSFAKALLKLMFLFLFPKVGYLSFMKGISK